MQDSRGTAHSSGLPKTSGPSEAERASGALLRLIEAITQPRPALRFAAGLLGLVLVFTMFWLGSKPGASAFIPTPPWDRLLHFVVYGGYAALAWVASGGRWLPALLAAVAIGLVDEGLQSRAPGRTADWTDIAADVAGALVAAWVLGALRRSVSRRSPAAPGQRRSPPAG